MPPGLNLAPFARWLPSTRQYIRCPHAEKDEAKALGAKWDRDRKMWYVRGGESTAPFAKWPVVAQ